MLVLNVFEFDNIVSHMYVDPNLKLIPIAKLDSSRCMYEYLALIKTLIRR